MPELRNQTFFEDIYCATFNGMSRFLGRAKLALAITDKRVGGTSYAVDPEGLLASFGINSSVLHNFLAGDRVRQQFGGRSEQALLVYSEQDGVGPVTTWVLERSPAVRHDGPIEQWLKEATILARMAANNRPLTTELHRSACDTLLSFASSAVKRAVQAKTRSYRLINPIDVVLNLTLAYEEGKKCSGNITFYDGAAPPTELLRLVLSDFSRPLLTSTKHFRKLMTSVEHSSFSILSDNIRAVGILDRKSQNAEAQAIIKGSIEAAFARGRADVFVDSTYLCSAYEGQLFSRSADHSELAIRQLLQTSTVLNQQQVDFLTNIFNRMVQYIQGSSSGCSLVLDTASAVSRLAGDYLDSPLDLASTDAMGIASKMAKIDGALHIQASGQLLAFGCLLDGRTCPGEDRARGARYNSAVRFTHDHPESFVITVSSDGPLSCFHKGKELTSVKPLILTEANLEVLP